MNNRWITTGAMLLMAAASAFAQSPADAVNAIRKEQYEKAKSLLKPLLANPAVAAEANFQMGQTYLKTGMPDSAQYYFQQGLVAAPASIPNQLGLGAVKLAEGDFAQAKQRFDQTLAALPKKNKDVTPYVVIADAYSSVDAERYNPELLATAMAYVSAGELVSQKNADLYVAKGDIYIQVKDGSQALAAYNTALNLRKDDPAVMVRRAYVYKAARNYEAAMEPVLEAIKVDPEFGPAYRIQADLYFGAAQYAKAVDIYKNKYMPLSDVSCNARERFATTLYLAKDYQSAVKELSEVIAACGDKPVLYRLLGYSYVETQQPAKADEALAKFMQTHDKEKFIPKDFLYAAKAKQALKQDSLAMVMAKQVLVLDPANQEALGLIAKSAYMSKNYTEAAAAYAELLKTPEAQKVPANYVYYGLSQYQNKDYQASIASFDQVLALSPTYMMAYLYKARAQAYLDPENTQALAKPTFEKLLELGKADVAKNKAAVIEALTYLSSHALLNANDKAAAKAYIDQLVAIDPANAHATNMMQLLKKG